MNEKQFLDLLIETLSNMLEHYGQTSNALFIEEIDLDAKENFHIWKNHLLLGTTTPTDIKNNLKNKQYSLFERDILGALESFKNYRKVESNLNMKAINFGQNFLWDFISKVSKKINLDEKVDIKILEELNLLKIISTDSTSLEDFKQKASNKIESIINIIDDRSKLNQKYYSDLQDKFIILKSDYENLKKNSAKDPLTNVYNRGFIDDLIIKEVNLNIFNKEKIFLIFIDIDNFKSINDTFGHPAGDEVLKAIADCCVKSFKRETDIVARYGGDEFIAIVHNISNTEMNILGNNLCRKINELNFTNPKIKTSCSIGAASLDFNDKAKDWLEKADKAVYDSKEAGKNTFTLF